MNNQSINTELLGRLDNYMDEIHNVLRVLRAVDNLPGEGDLHDQLYTMDQVAGSLQEAIDRAKAVNGCDIELDSNNHIPGFEDSVQGLADLSIRSED